MTTEQARYLIRTDPKFIYAKRWNYDLDELLRRYPDGCPDRVIAAVLMITEDDVNALHGHVLGKLRKLMRVGDSL